MLIIPPPEIQNPMVTQIIASIFAMLLPIIGAIVWLVRLEGKVGIQSERIDALKELILAEFRRSDADIGRRLDRIERSMNGHLEKD